MLVTPSTQGDGGTFFIAQASMPTTQPFRPGVRQNNPQPWSADAPPIIPQMTVAVEHYNRMVRMIELGEKLKMAVDLQVQYHTADLMAYNTIAEIPGSDLKDQIVMIGAHMDSWHSGTGATDNGAGVASVMEAVRIIKALKLQPRRTIRIGLWTGEEEGILGSKAYVAQHFGKFEERPSHPASRPGDWSSTTRHDDEQSAPCDRPRDAEGDHATIAARRAQIYSRPGIQQTLRLFQPRQRRGKDSRHLPAGQ